MIPIFKKTFTLLIRIFCIAMFSFQFYLLTRNYFQFNVRKEVTNYIENDVELPEIRVKVPYQFAFDLRFLKTKYSSGFTKACAYFSERKNCERYKTNVILFSKMLGPSLFLSDIAEYSFSAERIITDLTMSLQNYYSVENEKCKVKRKVSASSLILIISCLDSFGKPLKLSRSKTIVYNSRYLFGFSTNISTISFALNYPGKTALEDTGLYMTSTTVVGKETLNEIRFTKHTVNLLPPPFKTMCKDYYQRQVFDDCLNNKSMERTGHLYPETLIPLEKYSQSPGVRFNSLFTTDNGTLLEIREKCKSIVTQPMCNSVQYSFKTGVTFQNAAKGAEKQTIFLLVPTEFDSLVESKPDFPLVDYLILSGSLFSTWFGVSIMGQLLAASHLCCITTDDSRTVGVENSNNGSGAQDA